MENRKLEVENKIEELKEEMNDYQKDFINDYDIKNTRYLDDYITESADSQVSIYYYDIQKYYDNHTEESMNALKELGYNLGDFKDLQEAIYKGAQCAENLEIQRALYEDNRLEEYQTLLLELEELEEE